MRRSYLLIWSVIVVALVSCGCTSRVQAQHMGPFRNGDGVVFLGNSITDGGHYHAYIWLYYLTRFPEMNVTVINAGIGGDRVKEMLLRLEDDVLRRKPTVLITTFGMNDSGYLEYSGDNPEQFADQKVAESLQAYREMEIQYQAFNKTRIILLGSTPYDESVEIKGTPPLKGKNKTIQRIIAFQRASAHRNDWEFLDFNAPIMELNTRMQRQDPTFTLSGADRIHPDNDGHMVMAYLFLKAQGFSGKKVAAVTIDGRKGETTHTENCTVSELRSSERTIQFDYLPKALPYPLDTTARRWGAQHSQSEALKIVSFIQEMNQEELRITGLTGKYRLSIDGVEIGIWSALELFKGINLAAMDRTPQYQQAMQVMYLNQERWEIERRFREFAWVQYNFFHSKGPLHADNRQALETLDDHVASDDWLRAKRDLYVQAMHPEIREGWLQHMDDLVARMRRLSRPLNRHVLLEQI